MIKRNYSSKTSLLDLLFITLLGFVYLFFVAYLQMNPEAQKADIETKAEYVITVTWPKDFESDVDTWIEDPAGNIIYFRQKDRGLAHLDRDDLGNRNDSVIVNGQTIIYPYNQEIVTIRGYISGEWVLNIHLYSKRDELPVPVTVKMDKLNPSLVTVLVKTIILKKKWEEITVGRFVMAADGDIIEWIDIPKQLVEMKGTTAYPNGSAPRGGLNNNDPGM